MNEKVLEVPRQVVPIVDVHSQRIPERAPPPFFGFAPSEVPVWMVTCPECGAAVSAAHLNAHISSHEIKPQQPQQQHEQKFRLQTDSKLAPLTPSAYAERQAYTFKTCFNRDAK